MIFGLLFIIGGLFLMFWGLHYFGVLSSVGGSTATGDTSNG